MGRVGRASSSTRSNTLSRARRGVADGRGGLGAAGRECARPPISGDVGAAAVAGRPRRARGRHPHLLEEDRGRRRATPPRVEAHRSPTTSISAGPEPWRCDGGFDLGGGLIVWMRPTVCVRASAPAGTRARTAPCRAREPGDGRAPLGRPVSRLGASGHTPSSEMRPKVVFSPVVPQHADGHTDRAPGVRPDRDLGLAVRDRDGRAARGAAGDEPASSGLTGLPNQGLVPSGSIASSCRLVLPTSRASAARAPARQAASSVAGLGPCAPPPGTAGRRRACRDVDETLHGEAGPSAPRRRAWR